MKNTSVAALLALYLCLTPVQALEGGGGEVAVRALEASEWSQSGEVVAQALGQMGYTEAPDEYTVFGECYSYPYGFWCDMFVSWCADQAGVSEAAYPRSISCTQHIRMFSDLGRYRPSAARGGSYTPQQGDLVLFQKPETGITHHIGLVLYVEDGKVFTVEGNTLTSRWDYPADVISEARDSDAEPCDYVTCNLYALTDSRLHGYAVPAYTSREPLTLEGFVDLGRYSGVQEQINAVVAAGLMRGTSSHTFSPRAGMSRREFLETVLDLGGFSGWEVDTPFFDGVSMDHPYYSTVMTARAAGLIPEAWENAFALDIWISGEDAQYILSAARRRLGLEEQLYSFTPGDLSNILTPYTTRGDIAQALYSLFQDLAASSNQSAISAI